MTTAERYKDLAELTLRSERLDSSYQAAFYLLAADPELYELARRYIDVVGIDFTTIRRQARNLDERQKQVLSVAHNLFSWTSRCAVTPFDLSRLGYPLLDIVNTTIYIASDQVKVSVAQSDDGAGLMLCLDLAKYHQTRKTHRSLYGSEQAYAESLCTALGPDEQRYFFPADSD